MPSSFYCFWVSRQSGRLEHTLTFGTHPQDPLLQAQPATSSVLAQRSAQDVLQDIVKHSGRASFPASLGQKHLLAQRLYRREFDDWH